MDYQYLVIDSEINGRHSYGIAAVVMYDDIPAILDSIVDLSTNAAAVAMLVENCNMLALDPIHLRDVVYDFVTVL